MLDSSAQKVAVPWTLATTFCRRGPQTPETTGENARPRPVAPARTDALRRAFFSSQPHFPKGFRSKSVNWFGVAKLSSRLSSPRNSGVGGNFRIRGSRTDRVAILPSMGRPRRAGWIEGPVCSASSRKGCRVAAGLGLVADRRSAEIEIPESRARSERSPRAARGKSAPVAETFPEKNGRDRRQVAMPLVDGTVWAKSRNPPKPRETGIFPIPRLE